MNTQTIITKIRQEFFTDNSLFENYFADAIESANNYAIDSAVESFDLVDEVEFWENGVTNIDDEELRSKVNSHYFETFEASLRNKAKGIVEELGSFAHNFANNR